MEKKIKVLHVIKSLGRGGAERLLVSTIRQHNKQFQFDVVYFLPWKNQLVKDLETLGCTVTCLPSQHVFQMLLKLPALVRLIRKNQYQLMHAHLPWAGIMARMAGKITGVPLVYTEHNIFKNYKWPTRLVNGLTMNWQRMIIAVSDEVAKSLQQEVKPTVEVRTVLNCVDTTEFDRSKYTESPLKQKMSLPDHAVVVGTVAVFRPQKRLDRWLRIATALTDQFPNLYFVIVGDGLLRQELESQASPLIERKRLLFAGLTDEPERWMAGMDIYLMSSDFEGMPVALLEAMSMGCVPVVTAVGGIPAVIENNQNGFLYDGHDESKAIKQLGELVQNDDKRRQLAFNARTKIEMNHGIAHMVTQLEDVYRNLLRNG